jgi:TM2 domain-containing membrane protein YozV
MTSGPENPTPDPTDPTQDPTPDPTPDPTQPIGSTPPPPPPPPPSQPTPPPTPGYPGYPATGAPGGAYGVSSQAPYGLDPRTGIPYSDKSKIVAGLLQILLPFGIGRYYIGDNRIGVWQTVATVLTCGLAHIWVLIDGILMLVHDDTKDAHGYILRP